MKDEGIIKTFLRHLAMAIPWGIIFLGVLFIFTWGVKQQIKEGIQYTVRTAVCEAGKFAFNYHVVVPVKQNIKEGIEFSAKALKKELKELLNEIREEENLKKTVGQKKK